MGARDELVAECVEAASEPDPRGAVGEVLRRALANRKLAGELKNPAAGLTVL